MLPAGICSSSSYLTRSRLRVGLFRIVLFDYLHLRETEKKESNSEGEWDVASSNRHGESKNISQIKTKGSMPEKKCPSAKQAERVKAQKGVHKMLKLFFYIYFNTLGF